MPQNILTFLEEIFKFKRKFSSKFVCKIIEILFSSLIYLKFISFLFSFVMTIDKANLVASAEHGVEFGFVVAGWMDALVGGLNFSGLLEGDAQRLRSHGWTLSVAFGILASAVGLDLLFARNFAAERSHDEVLGVEISR